MNGEDRSRLEKFRQFRKEVRGSGEYFMGGEFRCRGGSCLKTTQPYNVASKDVTVMYLKDYGHLDVVAGTQSLKDVKKPMLKWMNERIK